MGEFFYTAVDKDGAEQRGTLEALTLNDALNRIRQMGLFSLEVVPAERKLQEKPMLAAVGRKLRIGNFRQGKIKQQELVIFTRQLSVLLDAGIPLVRCLNTLRKQSRFETIQQIITALVSIIESGKTFSEALGHYPSSFSKVYVNMVKAGETGGALDEVLRRLADYLEKSLRMNQRIRSALIYPCLVLLISIGILGFLISFVIPRFMQLFQDSGIALPFITRLMLGISELFRTHWYLAGALIVVALFIYRLLLRNYQFHYAKDKLKLILPVLGPLLQKIAASRFARTLSTLISGGVPILHSLELTRDISGNEVISKGIENVRASVSEGGGIARVLEQHNIFPQLMINMIAVGEESGSLDKMLSKVADAFEEEVDISTAALTSLIEPLLIIFLGVLIGFIVISMFLPLISLIQSLSQ